MDQKQCITLIAFLEDVPDPRQARGKRHEWRVLLAILCAGLLSGQRTVWGIVEWAVWHAAEIIVLLQIRHRRLPSAATFYRALGAVSVEALERRVAEFGRALDGEDPARGSIYPSPAGSPFPQPREVLRGQAVDGKERRGAKAHGAGVCLVSLVRHDSGLVLGQERVAQKTNEIRAVPLLLAGRDLAGTMTTMDALLSQRPLAQQIRDGGGHYLMIVKANQPELLGHIALLFQVPPVPADRQEYLAYRYVNKGHGRLEQRILESSTALNAYLPWPEVGQVLRRTCRRVLVKRGVVTTETTYAITSLTRAQAGPREIERLWRGHWTIENRNHYVRDETWGEDRCQVHRDNAPQALAALRNGVLNLLRHQGWENIAAALRFYGASLQKTMTLIGAATK
jgi:predicted transposase YbfD/YdcC